MLITISNLSEIRQRHVNEKIVLTSGTFDLFHPGHLSYLEAVSKYGDIVVVLLSSDKRVKAPKGDKRPILNEQERARILDSVKAVNYVFIDPSELDPDAIDPLHAQILEELKPDLYVTDGPDPRFYNIIAKSQFIILDRMNPEPSTTSIIERIQRLG